MPDSCIFGDWFELTMLDLTGTRVSNAGLVHLGELGRLKVLWLSGTPVTDDGLVHLRGLSRLQTLRLDGTPVTDAGVSGATEDVAKSACPVIEMGSAIEQEAFAGLVAYGPHELGRGPGSG